MTPFQIFGRVNVQCFYYILKSQQAQATANVNLNIAKYFFNMFILLHKNHYTDYIIIPISVRILYPLQSNFFISNFLFRLIHSQNLQHEQSCINTSSSCILLKNFNYYVVTLKIMWFPSLWEIRPYMHQFDANMNFFRALVQGVHLINASNSCENKYVTFIEIPTLIPFLVNLLNPCLQTYNIFICLISSPTYVCNVTLPIKHYNILYL